MNRLQFTNSEMLLIVKAVHNLRSRSKLQSKEFDDSSNILNKITARLLRKYEK